MVSFHWTVVAAMVMIGGSAGGALGALDSARGSIAIAPLVPAAPTVGAGSSESSAVSPAASSCTDCVLENISIPINPSSIAYDSNNQQLYVGEENAAAVGVINGTTNTEVANISVGTSFTDVPHDVAVDTATNDLYVANDAGNNVTVVNLATGTTIKSILVKPMPFTVVYDSGNGYLYVGEQGITTAWITVINGATQTAIANISLGTNTAELAEGLAVDTANGDLYAGNGQGNNITIVSLATNTVVGSIGVGYYPASLALDPSNHDLYAANTAGENVSVVDTSTNVAIKSIAINTSMLSVGPTAVAYDAATGCVYAPSGGGDWVSVIDTLTNALIGTIPIQGAPTSVAVDPANGRVYVPFINPSLTASYIAVLAVANCPSASVLASVSIAPELGEILLAGGSSTETATPTCSPAPCPGAVSYAWSIDNQSLGHLSSTTSNPTSVIAGGTSGDITVYVNASLGGFTVAAQAYLLLVISGSSPHPKSPNGSNGSSTGFLDLPGSDGVILVGVIGVIVVAGVVVALMLRGRGGGSTIFMPPPPTPYVPVSPPPPPPPGPPPG